MLKRFFRRRIDAFEKRWGYDSAYLREILEASPKAMLRIALAQPLLKHREDLPLDVYAAAQITATQAADCVPCLELGIEMARRAGLADDLLDAIVAGDVAKMTDGASLGYRFARAVVERDVAEAGRVRGEVLRTLGRRALVSLSIAVATASFYPTLKHGMGRGRTAGGLGAAVAGARARAA